jgi:hypothetical protein
MTQLNKDVLLMILEELKDDRTSLHSCLLVNRTWCEITVPILWKTIGRKRLFDNAIDKLFNVVHSHLSEDSKVILKEQGINLFTEDYRYRQPLFNYIKFLEKFELTFDNMIYSRKTKDSDMNIIRKELLKLFINKNTKFISLAIPPTGFQGPNSVFRFSNFLNVMVTPRNLSW